MPITHKRNVQVSSSGGGQPLTGAQIEVGGSEQSISQVFAASTVNQAVTATFTVAGLQSIYLLADKGCTIKTNGAGTNEVQTLTITGTPSGGHFEIACQQAGTLSLTGPIAYNAIAATVQTALQALANLGSGNVTCTGRPLPGTPVTITFAGTLASKNTALLVANSGGLTGGSSPTATITTTTPGLPSDTIVLQPNAPFVWSRSEGYYANPFTVDVTGFYVSTTLAGQLRGKILVT